MIDIEIKSINPDDIEVVLKKVETSFDIEFTGDELMPLNTFGELCDHITNKIQLEQSNDCTSQQAFYKLRTAINQSLYIDSKAITLNTSLESILPKNTRHSNINNLETALGFKLHLLRPPYWASSTLLLLSLASIVGLFINSSIGMAGLALSISGFWFAIKTANVHTVQTVEQLTEKITREHYLKSRRNHKTFNKGEVEKILIDLFSNELFPEKHKLTRNTKIE